MLVSGPPEQTRATTAVRYTEYTPPPPLSSIVGCLWTLDGHASEADAVPQLILPDGRPELVVHFGDPFERVEPDGAAWRQPTVIFAGQLTGPLLLRPTGRISVLGVRFHPDGAAGLITAPQHDLAGLTIGVDSVSAPLAHALRGIRESAGSLADAARAVEDCLIERCDLSRIDPRVRHVVDDIRRFHGSLAVGELARRAGLTRRHLERRFKDVVGVSPKRLARITRFRRARRMLERLTSARPGTLTAVTCGYADQAHFIREFREFTGCAPTAHAMGGAELSGFFDSGPE